MSLANKCEGCGKIGCAFRCPKCAELRLPDSHWCSQKCYKGFWVIHKLKHSKEALLAALSAAAQIQMNPPSVDERFSGYHYTGNVTKFQLTPRRSVPAEIPKPDYAETGYPAEEKASNPRFPEVKTPEQIAGMRAACIIAREVLDTAAKAVRVGITTDELDQIVHETTIAKGAYPSPLNYSGFPKSVCTSVNEIVCHGIPDKRPLENGDIVNIDVTVYYKGYNGDINETYPVGEIDGTSKKLIQSAYECMMEGIKIVAPGTAFARIGDVITRQAKKDNFTVNRHYCGHGIGHLFHTEPTIPHYAKNKMPGTMVAGNTFTIEPMIHAGNCEDVLWPDDWTVATADGKRSAQFEHTILVTENGYEILTARTASSYPYWFLPH